MKLILSPEDLAQLSPPARREVLDLLQTEGGSSASASEALPDAGYAGIDLTDVVDLSFRQMRTWMEGASGKTKLGLRVIAEHGPVVRAQLFLDAGISNLSHFQSRTTIRTRTVTGKKNAFLLGWDDWSKADDGEGRYAVTPATHRSLRRYFQLS